MTAHARPLDMAKFAKVAALMEAGATEGERDAARARAEAMASAAGMSLADAIAGTKEKPAPAPRSFFDGFDDWMEARKPGYKASEAVKRAARNAREAARRAEVLAAYGSEAALFARTPWEAMLDAAIEPLATWGHWTDKFGAVHRYAETLDGKKASYGFWRWDDITPVIHDAVTGAYPWPSALADALAEVKVWDRLRWDRGLFGGEWNHYAEVECRIELLERALKCAQPAASWEDVQARFDWKRYDEERGWLDPTPREDPFLDRLESDFATLRAAACAPPAGAQSTPGQFCHPVTTTALAERRTNAQKRAEVLAMLKENPELSDGEISRRCGVSRQNVSNHRKARHAQPKD